MSPGLGWGRSNSEEIKMGKFITIATFTDLIDAQLLKARLESADIKCFLADEHTVAVNWLFSNFIGGVKVQIQKEDLEKAKEIIGEGC